MCGGGFVPPTQEVGYVVVVGCCGMSLTSFCAVVQAMPYCLWTLVGSVKISWRMGLFEEQDGTVVGVFWPLSGPLSILIAHFWLTPLQWT